MLYTKDWVYPAQECDNKKTDLFHSFAVMTREYQYKSLIE